MQIRIVYRVASVYFVLTVPNLQDQGEALRLHSNHRIRSYDGATTSLSSITPLLVRTKMLQKNPTALNEPESGGRIMNDGTNTR